MKITGLSVRDIRTPTSRHLDGSDAMNPDPDYSAAYVTLHTDGGIEGNGLTFTIGRGTEVVVAAVDALRPLVVGLALGDIADDMSGFWRTVTGDSQLRWIGPEKGAIHLATAAVVNAVWDLWAKAEGVPVWKLVAGMKPEQFASCVDFRYLTDVIGRDEAVDMLTRAVDGRDEREARVLHEGYPAYITSAGWLGYPDEKVRALTRAAVAEGWHALKIKVGRDVDDDVRRCRAVRDEIGPDRLLLTDANQVWDVPTAIDWVGAIAPYAPAWIEEPTSPDDILGHAAIRRAVSPIGVATGEHCHNRVMFKQFFEADAIDYCQLDSCRLGGLNEVLAVLLLAAKYDVPVCPHAGGIGLCEYVQHISLIDYLCVSGTLDRRMAEYAGHGHEMFVDPVVVEDGRYRVPTAPGYSITMNNEALETYRWPDGAAWA